MMAEGKHLVLVGLPGAGKTSVGRRLAKDLQRPFADLDEQIELHVGRSLPRVFVEDGEAAFRQWETEVFRELLGREWPLVIATGGGTVVRPENQEAAQAHGVVVWLRASPSFLVARTDRTHRPILDTEDPEATYERLTAERTELYARVADLTVDVESFQVDEGDKPKNAISRHIIDRLAEEAEGVLGPSGGAG